MCGEKLDGLRRDTQKCNTVSQLLIFNYKKKQKSISLTAKERHIIEMLIPLYIGMKIHTTTRSKTLIEKFPKLGLSVSYDRVLQVDRILQQNQCMQFENDGMVCPFSFRKGILTVGAIDNIDHNPSSTTSKGSLHGTAITVTQLPTEDNQGLERPIEFDSKLTSTNVTLPASYSNVPVVSVKGLCEVPHRTCTFKSLDVLQEA